MSSLAGLISVVPVNENRTIYLTTVFKTPSAELGQNACGVVIEQKVFCCHPCSPESSMNQLRVYIHRHVFRPSQVSWVWLGLTSREQLMSPECSRHQVLSFAKMLVVGWTNKKCSILISVLQSAQWINSKAYIHRHVFRPSQDSSLWLELMSRAQLMSPESSKHQVVSFA